MKRFVVPPNWPTPPRRSWVPPKTWRPDPSWPPAPAGWKFWVDGKGSPVHGPVGLYGGTSRRTVIAGISGAMVFLVVNLWALSAIGLFDGPQASTQQVAGPLVDDKSPTPTVTPPRTTQPPTPVKPSTPAAKPTVTPTKTRTVRPQPTEERSTKPTQTATPSPTRSTQTPLTREEILRQYCAERGWDYDWCDPDNWPRRPPRGEN